MHKHARTPSKIFEHFSFEIIQLYIIRVFALESVQFFFTHSCETKNRTDIQYFQLANLKHWSDALICAMYRDFYLDCKLHSYIQFNTEGESGCAFNGVDIEYMWIWLQSRQSFPHQCTSIWYIQIEVEMELHAIFYSFWFN